MVTPAASLAWLMGYVPDGRDSDRRARSTDHLRARRGQGRSPFVTRFRSPGERVVEDGVHLGEVEGN